MDPRNSNGESLLHLVVSKVTMNLFDYLTIIITICDSKTNTMKSSMAGVEETYSSVFPDYNVCKLLLESGYEVDKTNYSLETPLHIASSPTSFNADIVYLLLSRGAHIDRKDLTGNQPCRRLAAISKCKSINFLKYSSLGCLAATAIKAYNLPFIGSVPIHLEEFINLH